MISIEDHEIVLDSEEHLQPRHSFYQVTWLAMAFIKQCLGGLCMTNQAGILALPELVPVAIDPLLTSTSITAEIRFAPFSVYCCNFDERIGELPRLTFQPITVSSDGNLFYQAKGPASGLGWSFDRIRRPVLRIPHSTHQMEISGK
jgi:hypothetical protein